MNGQFDIGAISPTKYFFSIAVVLGLLFAMISTDQDRHIALIFLQWQLQAVVPMALMIGTHRLLLNSGLFAALNPWLGLAISGVIGATLFSPVALGIDFWLDGAVPGSLAAELFDEWLSVAPPVTLCWLALNAPWQLGYRLEKSPGPGGAENAGADAPAAEFIAQLPPDKRGKILLLKSELHYLQVVTEHGSALILYNLGDAAAQMPPALGMIVHRSYWVAFDAIEAFTRRGRQGELRLVNGERVPVSRNRLAEVERSLSATGPA